MIHNLVLIIREVTCTILVLVKIWKKINNDKNIIPRYLLAFKPSNI